MQNTMVRGEGECSAGGKKLQLGEKMKKGKEKRRKITLKKGGKGLKNASFWAINSKKKSPSPPQTYLSGKKNLSFNSKEGGGGGNYQNAQYISLCLC